PAGPSPSMRRAASAADVVLPPEREVEQEPQAHAVALLEQAVDGGLREVVGLPAELRQLAPRHVAQAIEEPLVDRHPEALLGPVDDLVGDHAADGLLEDVLELA